MPYQYDVNLSIDPASEMLAARVDLTCEVTAPLSELEFLLYSGLAVESAEGTAVASHTFSDHPGRFPYAPGAGTLLLQLREVQHVGQTVEITLRYSGKIPPTAYGVNRLTRTWIELGLYAPWFPFDPYGGLFTYRIHLDIDQDYRVIGSGTATQHDGKWTFVSASPSNDMVIMAAPSMAVERCAVDSVSTDAYYVTPQQRDAARDVAQLGTWLLRFFGNWFADTNRGRHAIIVSAPRTEGGGYARPGLIVLSTLTNFDANQRNSLRYLAHELAHLWWSGAPVDSWEDWLNESFAEYCALAAVGTRLGEDARNQLLAEKRDLTQNLPPIAGMERTAKQAHAVLYHKGPLLLARLEQKMGQALFTELLRSLVRQPKKDTAGFLGILTELSGRKVADWFRDQLKE